MIVDEDRTVDKLRSRTVSRIVAAIAGSLTLILITTGCSLLGLGSPKGKETLTIGIPVAPSSLNPALSLAGRVNAVLQPAYEPLVKLGAKGEALPGLATSWKVDDALTTITFTLRRDVQFSNGEAVTPAAVKNSILYFKNAGGPYAGLLRGLKDISTQNDDTVLITFSTPQPDLTALFSSVFNIGDIIAPAALSNPQLLTTNTFGAGPYILDSSSTVSGSRYTFTPNKAYYDQGQIEWPGIEMSVFTDQNQAMTAFKNGQIMVAMADPITAGANAASLPSGTHTFTAPSQWTGVVFSDRAGDVTPALANVNVRRALNFATDRQAIATNTFGKFATPTTQLQVEGFIGFEQTNDSAYPFNLEKAKELMAQAGYASGFTLTMGYIKNTINELELSQITEQWAKINVKVVGSPVGSIAELAILGGGKKVGAVLGQAYSTTPYAAYSQTLSTTGSYNIYGSSDPALTTLVNSAISAGVSQQESSWKAVHRWVVDQAWFDVFASLPNIVLTSNKVKSVKLGTTPVIDVTKVVPN